MRRAEKRELINKYTYIEDEQVEVQITKGKWKTLVEDYLKTRYKVRSKEVCFTTFDIYGWVETFLVESEFTKLDWLAVSDIYERAEGRDITKAVLVHVFGAETYLFRSNWSEDHFIIRTPLDSYVDIVCNVELTYEEQLEEDVREELIIQGYSAEEDILDGIFEAFEEYHLETMVAEHVDMTDMDRWLAVEKMVQQPMHWEEVSKVLGTMYEIDVEVLDLF